MTQGPAGTDATHAEHIETIKARMYVGLTPDKRFLPGHLGMGLVEGEEAGRPGAGGAEAPAGSSRPQQTRSARRLRRHGLRDVQA